MTLTTQQQLEFEIENFFQQNNCHIRVNKLKEKTSTNQQNDGLNQDFNYRKDLMTKYMWLPLFNLYEFL